MKVADSSFFFLPFVAEQVPKGKPTTGAIFYDPDSADDIDDDDPDEDLDI